MNPKQRLLASRRKFLASVGVGAAALPFLRMLPGYAQGASNAKLITVFSGCGRIRHLWGGDASSGSLMLKDNLAPLQPFAEHITVLEGIRNFCAPIIGGTHEGGMESLFTGRSSSGSNYTSIDTLFMSQVQGTAKRDSLYQQVVAQLNNAQSSSPNNRCSFDASGTARDPWRSGWEVSEQYLAGAIQADTNPTEMSGADKAQGKMFAALATQMNSVLPRLCAEDRYQLEGMADAVNNASKTITKVTCSLPELPPKPMVESWEAIWQPPGGNAPPIPLGDASHWYRDRSRLAIDLLVASLACGVTRSGVLQFDQAASDAVATGQPDGHHNLSHQVPQLFAFVEGVNGDASNNYEYTEIDHQADPSPAMRTQFDATWKQLSMWETFYAEEVAYLVSQLQTFGILDDTLMLWGTEIDNSAGHEHFNMPFVIAAGAQIPIKRGSVVNYPLSYPEGSKIVPSGISRSHNDLLRTVLHAVGLEVNSVGDAAQNKGLLTELLA